VGRSALWLALQGIGTPDIVLNLPCDFYLGTGARVRVELETSDCFNTTSGVRQGCVLASAFFCRVINWIMEHVSGRRVVNLGRNTVSDFNNNNIAIWSGMTNAVLQVFGPL